MKFINVGPVYIRGWAGGVQSGVGGGKTLKKEDTNSIVQSTYNVYIHPQRANIQLQGLDRHALTVGAISVPLSQLAIGAHLWCHFTSHGFTWSAKSIQGKQTS